MVDNKEDVETKADSKDLQSLSRRKAVKKIAGGVSALAAYHTLPVNWSKPIIEQVFLPAHAQTSGDFTDTHPLVHDHTHENSDPNTQEVVDPNTNAVLHVHTHPHKHQVGDPDYHADLGTPDSSSGIDHSHTHSHSEPHSATCTQCGQQLLTDGIGGLPLWDSLTVPYNSANNTYRFAQTFSYMYQVVALSESCIGSTLRLSFGDGGGVGPLRVSVGVGNTVQQRTYSGGGLNFDVPVPAGPTDPVTVRIEAVGTPHDSSTTIISPTLTVVC